MRSNDVVTFEAYLQSPERYINHVVEGSFGYASDNWFMNQLKTIRFAIRGIRSIYYREMGDSTQLLLKGGFRPGDIVSIRFVPLRLTSDNPLNGEFEIVGASRTDFVWKDQGEGLPQYAF